ncbi:DNA polymerase III sliding clamp [Gordonia phage Jumbo]|uniref:DNA polymerase III sliding clamp n=1 Tax=Gordonia phage Jumbo TaxID=1887650 RepID=A0A1B3B0M1_9CAUD|nr:DNA polymerase processivity factor [Gordonia phage Jumbo]AOE44563.1 DNA polymerase III sliding clamp [Gordonia phage Jumbo]
MSYAIVETSTIADALNKAARVSPSPHTTGEMFSSGILIDFDENTGDVFVSSTDLSIFYRQRVAGLKISGKGTWKISPHVAKFIDTLPKGQGSTVKLDDENAPGCLTMTREHSRGATVGTMPLIGHSDFPEWAPYTETGGVAVSSLSDKLEAVSWAAAKEDGTAPELTGVYLDGYGVLATNRYVAASVPLGIPPLVDAPMTVPVSALTGVIHHAGDSLVVPTNKGLGITPDDFTQVEVVRFDRNIHQAFKRTDANDYTGQVTINTDEYRDVCDRIFKIMKKDEKGRVNLLAAKDSLLFSMRTDSGKSAQDVIGATGGPDIPTALSVNALYVRDAVSRAIGANATIYFEQGVSEQNKFTYIQGGAGYEAWISPLRDIS